MSAKLSKPNTVPTPDEFFDIALKECTPTEVVILALVIKHTLKFGKQWDWLSRAQIQSEVSPSITGTDIYKAIESLVQNEWLLRVYECAKCKSQSLEFSKGGECQECGQKGLLHPYYTLNLGDDLISHLNKIRPLEEKEGLPLGKGLPIGKGVAYRQGGCLMATQETSLQETSLQETSLQETSTNNTTKTTMVGSLNPTSKKPKNFIDGQAKNFISYASLHLIERHVPAKAITRLTYHEESSFCIIYNKYGAQLAYQFVDQTASWNGKGLSALKATIKRWEKNKGFEDESLAEKGRRILAKAHRQPAKLKNDANLKKEIDGDTVSEDIEFDIT